MRGSCVPVKAEHWGLQGHRSSSGEPGWSSLSSPWEEELPWLCWGTAAHHTVMIISKMYFSLCPTSGSIPACWPVPHITKIPFHCWSHHLCWNLASSALAAAVCSSKTIGVRINHILVRVVNPQSLRGPDKRTCESAKQSVQKGPERSGQAGVMDWKQERKMPGKEMK